MVNTGQQSKLQYAEQVKAWNKLLMVFSDGEWHRIKDLRMVVSSRTLYDEKFLRTFERLIEKLEDKENGKYAVYYRANPILLLCLQQAKTTVEAWKEIEEQFLETKNLAFALEQINAVINLFLVLIVGCLKERKDLRDSEAIELLLETFVWESYKTLTRLLAKAYVKTIS